MTQEALIIQQPGGPARQLVLLFHGLGANEEDLRPVGERLAAEYPEVLDRGGFTAGSSSLLGRRGDCL